MRHNWSSLQHERILEHHSETLLKYIPKWRNQNVEKRKLDKKSLKEIEMWRSYGGHSHPLQLCTSAVKESYGSHIGSSVATLWWSGALLSNLWPCGMLQTEHKNAAKPELPASWMEKLLVLAEEGGKTAFILCLVHPLRILWQSSGCNGNPICVTGSGQIFIWTVMCIIRVHCENCWGPSGLQKSMGASWST